MKKRQKRRSQGQSFYERSALGLGAVASLGFLTLLILAAWGYANLTADLPPTEKLGMYLDPRTGTLLQPTRLYDRSGQQVIYSLENPGIQRHFLSLDPNQPEHFSPQLVHATISIIEPAFWQQPGFNISELLDSDARTIAERLVDDLLLSQETNGIRRSLRMRLLAAQLVARYGRTRVLEWFLNSAYFGHLAYGADSAARLYLGKSASQLDMAESALLLAALEAPALNPMDAPAAAMERQKDILQRLRTRGAISEADYQQLSMQPLALNKQLKENSGTAHAFSQLVVKQLNREINQHTVERGGLKVITSLDNDQQQQLVCILRTQLARLENNPEPQELPDGAECQANRLLPTMPGMAEPMPTGLRGSAVVLAPKSGEILALVGDISSDGTDIMLKGHAPGSMLTPFIALAGFARGFSPASLVWDIPASLPASLADYQHPDQTYHGPQRLRMALANDYLAPLAQLLIQIGPANVWRFNEPLGLGRLGTTPDPASLVFTGGDLTTLELAQVYSIFANLGTQIGRPSPTSTSLQPIMIKEVQDLNGNSILPETVPQSRIVISQPLAYLVHHVLSDESARWPSLGYPNSLEIGRPAGAKTGLADDGHSIWSTGYTPQHLVVIWMGLPDDSAEDVRLSTKMAAGAWYAAIQYLSRGLPVENWEQPPGISSAQVCDPSGRLPTRDCPLTVNEIFLEGNQPTAYDSLYRVFQVNRETGLLATVFTPPELVEERTYLVYPPDVQAWAQASNIEQPPTLYDAIQAPPPKPGAQLTSPAQFSYAKEKVELFGSAGDEGFVYYRLQFGQGLNPRTWQNIGTENFKSVENGRLGIWDTTGLEGLYALRLLVVRQDQQIDTATLQLTIDNIPPSLRIIYPTDGAVFHYPTENQITFQVEVQEVVGIRRVEWYLDNKKIGETFQAPYLLVFTTDKGTHTLLVKAEDLAGNTSESTPISFRVD